jgi:hypothetical protein
MSTRDYYLALGIRLFGNQYTVLEPSAFVYFHDGRVVLNTETGEVTIGSIAIHIRDFVNEMDLRKANGGGSGRTIVAQIIADFWATPKQKEQPKLKVVGGKDVAPRPDSREVREFVSTVVAQAKAATKHIVEEGRHPGLLQISLIHPADEEVSGIYRYELDDPNLIERMTGEAVNASESGHNVYIEGRTVRRGLSGKQRGGLNDTVAVFALVVDSDADKGKAWTPTVPVSLTVNTSPDNHHYWLFSETALDPAAAQKLGARLRAATNADDDTGNVCQPYRIAGTVNYPGKKKLERGRIVTETRMLGFDPETLWTPERLEQEFPTTTRTPTEDLTNFKVAEEFADLPRESLSEGLYDPYPAPELIAAALAVIPRNDDDPHSENYWQEIEQPPGRNYMVRIGMAVKAASNGSAEGKALFVKWRTSGDPDCDADKASKKYDGFHPTDIGAATLFWLADKASPGWREKYEDQQEEGKASKTALPKLIINISDPTATAKALAALIATRDDFLFNGNAAVRIAVEAGYPPRALEVVTDAVRILAHKICIPIKPKGKLYDRVPLSKDIAQLYLHGLEGSWGLKPFNGITTAPILGNDGSIRTASGYDARTGLWCHNIPDITVPTKPTKADAKQALQELRGFFRTFPFTDAARREDKDLAVEVVDLSKDAGLDESSFLATLLTAVCRQSLELAPGFLCDAPNYSGSGTGKGLLVKAVCTIAAGFTPAAFTGGHDAEELDKRLTSALIEGRPAAFLDNFNSKNLISDTLSSALTENPAMVRVLGLTKMTPLYTRIYIGIAGNAVQIAEDMARRLLNSHLDAKMENPEQRKFAPGFLDHILANRSKLLAAALTIWRWGRQNRLTQGKPLGSYELWAQWCRDPLLELGTRDPVDRIDEIKAADPKRRNLIAIFDQWWTSDADAVLKATDLAEEVIKLIDDKAFVKSDGAGGSTLQYSRQRIAGFLARHTDTRVGGYILTKTTQGPASKETAQYKLIRPADHPSKAEAPIPSVFTRAIREQLRQCGLSNDEIAKLTLQQAQDIIREHLPASDFGAEINH